MRDKEFASHRRQQTNMNADTPEQESHGRVTWIVGSALFAAFIVQACVQDDQLSADLSLSWTNVKRGQLWQVLSYPFALPETRFYLSSGFLIGLEYLLSGLVLLGFGYAVEQKLGQTRTAVFYLYSQLTAAVLTMSISGLFHGVGQIVCGPLPLALSMLGLVLFIERRRRTPWAQNIPVIFFMLTAFFVTLSLIELGLANRSESFRATIACLPMIFVGAGFVGLDNYTTEYLRKRADKHEVNLVIEEVNARAEVDRLLCKIGSHGMGSLTKKEQSFLKMASKFYQQDSSRHKEQSFD